MQSEQVPKDHWWLISLVKCGYIQFIWCMFTRMNRVKFRFKHNLHHQHRNERCLNQVSNSLLSILRLLWLIQDTSKPIKLRHARFLLFGPMHSSHFTRLFPHHPVLSSLRIKFNSWKQIMYYYVFWFFYGLGVCSKQAWSKVKKWLIQENI